MAGKARGNAVVVGVGPTFRERYDVIEVIGSPYADSRVPELATPIHVWSTTILC